jgi:hypothetical protein
MIQLLLVLFLTVSLMYAILERNAQFMYNTQHMFANITMQYASQIIPPRIQVGTDAKGPW